MELINTIINSPYFDAVAGFLVGGGVFSGVLIKILKTSFKELGAIKNGVKAILHSQIYKDCESWIEKGYCPLEERQELEYLFKPYKALNGNSTAEDLYNRTKRLPYSLEEMK